MCEHEMFSRLCLGQKRADLLHAEVAAAHRFPNLGHGELARRILREQVFVSGVVERCLQVHSDLPDRGFAIAVFSHLVHEQLKGTQADLIQPLLANHGQNVSRKNGSNSFPEGLGPLARFQAGESPP